MVVLGYGSKPERELHVDACLEDGIPLFRRRGGGCAVLLDPGGVIVSVVLAVEGIGGTKSFFDRLTSWLAGGLENAGVEGIERAGIFDLTIGGRKISGGSTHRTREILFWTASVLVTPRIDLMERYLQHPPREPKYRAHRGHASFVTGLAEAGWPGDASSLAEALRSNLPEP